MISIIYYLGCYHEYSFFDKYLSDNGSYQSDLLQKCREENKASNLDIANNFYNNGYKKVCIYGLGRYYFEFIDDLNSNPFSEIYLMDSNAQELQKDFEQSIYTINDVGNLDMDVIVVTSLAHYKDIRTSLLGRNVECEIVAYNDLVYNSKKEAGKDE